MGEPGEITRCLAAAREGDREALDRLMPLVYEELRHVARRQLVKERPGHTFDSRALVHEAYLKLARLQRIAWQDRVHFYAISARVMRRILLDHVDARGAVKRGGGAVPVTLDGNEPAVEDRAPEFAALDEALVRLEALNARQCRVVECRFFAGLTAEETAEALGISLATVKRDWTLARAFLNSELA
jgi:RNA polymerase sigma factor (TIGR02999 family)